MISPRIDGCAALSAPLAPRAAAEHAKESSSFLKKRTKKLLSLWHGAAPRSEANNQKFFASFFQKRSASFLSTARSAEDLTAVLAAAPSPPPAAVPDPPPAAAPA